MIDPKVAHARLVTTDLPAALAILVALWAFWRFTRRPGWSRAVVCAARVACGLAVKFSALLVLPMVALGAALWIAQSDPTPGERRRRVAWLAALAPTIALASWAGLWCVYGFRWSAAADPGYSLDWSVVGTRSGVAFEAVRLALETRPLPEAWLYGLADFLGGAARRVAFLNGEISLVGWWSYFPEATGGSAPSSPPSAHPG